MKATKYQKKSLIKLEDLLRKRKTNLKKFLVERGITTYSVLEETCSRLGVITPNFETFNACIPSYVSDPTAGVVVVPPLDVVVGEATFAHATAGTHGARLAAEQHARSAAQKLAEEESTRRLSEQRRVREEAELLALLDRKRREAEATRDALLQIGRAHV